MWKEIILICIMYNIWIDDSIIFKFFNKYYSELPRNNS